MSARKNGKDSQKAAGAKTNGDALQRAVQWILNDGIFAQVQLHGNISWVPVALVRLAIFWVWSSESSLVAAAQEAILKVTALWGSAAVGSYQALTGVLKRYTPQLLGVLWGRLQQLSQQWEQKSWRVGLWLVLAMDGSRLLVPRTSKNEQRFCKPPRKRGKKKRQRKGKRGRHANRQRVKTGRSKSHYDPQPVGPQLWLTLFWHLGQRLPWCWKIGPSYASERTHVTELLAEQTFPEATLFCGDAGFVGYEFWQSIASHGHHFIVRVGSNVRLLRKLGYVRERKGIVYCWPAKALKRLRPPLVLRLLRFQDKRGDVYLVTNVISERKLTCREASEIYRRRWGIELQFRSFKQTFTRSKLRSRTPECAEVELHWSLLGLWMLQLLAYKEQTAAGEPETQTSIAAVLRTIRCIMYNQDQVPMPGQSLTARLQKAKIDSYVRHSKKKNRNHPRRKEEPSAGPPIITLATKLQRQALGKLEKIKSAA